MTNDVHIIGMIEELKELNGYDFEIPKDRHHQEDILKKLMTVSSPGYLSDGYYEAEKIYLDIKRSEKDIVSVEAIDEKLMDGIYIFKGDITSLEADAIVNAANEKLLGCFIPGHACIDNAIHLSAGLGLRNACNRLMESQGHDEPAGLAKVTEGYNLPAKYVVHTVGPNMNGHVKMDMETVLDQLKSCYMSILDSVFQYEDIRNIVFCSISTGIYGVPIELASEVALRTIKNYLNTKPHHLDKVMIDVFSEEDYNVYKEKAKCI